MPLLISGSVAVVTGAARGIGRSTALKLAAEGARVVASDMDSDALGEVAAAIRSSGGEAQPLVGDVTAPGFAEELMAACLGHFGRLDILVNNAGYTWDGVLHKMTDVQWEAMLDVHLRAPFRILRAAAVYLREAAKQEIGQSGRARARKVVNISSTSGTRGNFGQANYAAAKAGIVGLTKTLAREWGHLNIQVNCAAFGLIDTRLTAAKENGEEIRRGENSISLGIPSSIRDTALKLIPMGRPGTAEEAASVVLFLASPLSNYVSGQVIEATGGL